MKEPKKSPVGYAALAFAINIRYSMQDHRRQEQIKGRWVSVGQQHYPDCVDLQR